MKQAKTFSIIFGVVTILLLCTMCSVVAYSYAHAVCLMKHSCYAAPPSIAFLLAIPFAIGIVISSILSWFFYRKTKKSA